MIRSAARQFLSVRRQAWSVSVGRSLAGSGTAPSGKDFNNTTCFPSKRLMSATPSGGSFSATLPGFGSSPISPESDVDTSVSDSPVTTAMEQLTTFEPSWWPSDQVLVLINWVNETAGFPCYAYAIGATTLAFRVALLPLFIRGQRTSSRTAHMQPEMKAMKEELDKMGGKIDQQTQMIYNKKTQALFRKYDCNPFSAILPPLVSAPIFMSMFFGLRNAPEYFPELLSTGGMLWFTDLTAADPYCIMPVFSALLFLGITEAGKEQMMASDPVRGRTMVNAFRALAIVMVPLTMNFESSVFVYWTINNSFSFMQTMILKQPSVRKYFGIWEPPKPIPGQAEISIFDEIKNLAQKKKKKEPNAWDADRVKANNEIIEQQKMVRKKLMEREGLKTKG
jgi:YidC/Oxa1 family membrane protein insertase